MNWQLTNRADTQAASIADRHYTRQAVGSRQFVQPGRCVVLVVPDAPALWVSSWPRAEYVRHAWAGAWMCSLFRNEAPDRYLSSELIIQAVAATRAVRGKPPKQGFVTFVDAGQVKPKRDPGRCYRRAGWEPVGYTQSGLIALQLLPANMPFVCYMTLFSRFPAPILMCCSALKTSRGNSMSGRFFTRTRLALLAGLFLPWLLPLLLQSISPTLSFVFGVIAVICSFAALAFLISPTRELKLVPTRSVGLPPVPEAEQEILSIPMTLAELCNMDPTDFEIFSAAVIVGGVADGHRFISHSGKRGDRGVDIRLQNKVGLRVVVQSKRYALHRRVGPVPVRELGWAVQTNQAAYGYFVTTSTFTRAAQDDIESSRFIRTIDGPHLEVLLQTRAPQIAQAYDDIHEQIQAETY